MSKNSAYAKYNFILSIIGFIGSLGFYFGVLKEVSSGETDRILIKQLQDENRYLKEHIKEITLQKSQKMERAKMVYELENAYVKRMVFELEKGEKLNRVQSEKLAFGFGIEDKTKVKELTELAIVQTARSIALSSDSNFDKYQEIVKLYERQTNLSFRTSQSILLRQYSTPAPIGFLMGIYCGIDSNRKTVFEPSAGNGLLTIATHPKLVTVNEVDKVRSENLKRQNFHIVLKQDASTEFVGFDKKFDAVLTNPPFGRIGKTTYIDSYRIYDLDHYMSLLALRTMKDKGKCAFIIGGHTSYDQKGRIQAGKNRIFFNYLYHHYNVEDVIPIDGSKLYSRQGTSFDTRLVLINGRKTKPNGVAPLMDSNSKEVVKDFDHLYNRVLSHLEITPNTQLEKEAKELEAILRGQSLDAPYVPSSKACVVLDTQVPDSMDYEVHNALKYITKEVGGDMDNFVRHRLGYFSKTELCKALSAEQIDAVGMAIYNVEALNQSLIIGDQTGIGKGRVAAAMIRYAALQGLKPIFLTEKANLFSDIYRDLSAIGSKDLKPFIVNGRESKTDIKDEDGLVIYQAPSVYEQNLVFESGDLKGYDFVIGTYSQFNSPLKKSTKPQFLLKIAKDNILIMDESHNASGLSNTGTFMQQVLYRTTGAVFLSATFAKRPDNMPIYAMKTAISEANMSQIDLVEAILKGGVALQEVLASQLVAEGQMIRRERSYEGIEVNYITLENHANEHRAIADNITQILRDIISFQSTYVDKQVNELDEIFSKQGSEVQIKEGTSQAGVDNMPYFSKVFNVINQMLFSIKAEAVADRAIERLKEGKKPVIAFSSTMGSFLEQMEDESGISVQVGDNVKTDFALVLEKGLQGVMRYTVTLPDGTREHAYFELSEFSEDAQKEYFRISEQIRSISTGICISPIDVIVERIEKAGFTVAEVTGRKLKLQLNDKGTRGIVTHRKKINTNDAFREFNNNEIDVLLINQSGSTGASAHAIVTNKVSESKVKQRVMIVLQPELDINIEIQKRGRINRTGQILKPIYDYVNSAIPAELRLMMMLQKKLKSLDANTSSNQKQSSSILDVPDFLNKYGDAIVFEYLKENLEINRLLGDPLKLSKSESEQIKEDAALKVSGRVAVLSVKMQEDFYTDIKELYQNQVNYLKQTGEYDLEVEQMDLKAKKIESSVIKIGRGGHSSFGEDSILEKVQANNLRKPFKADELQNLITQSLQGLTASEVMEKTLEDYNTFWKQNLEQETKDLNQKYDALIEGIPKEKKTKKLMDEMPSSMPQIIEQRKQELESAKAMELRDFQKVMDHKLQTIGGNIKYFTIGKRLLYPLDSFDGSSVNQLAVFLGFKIDPKKKNPYAPSSLLLRFAIANSQKYLEIPFSKYTIISAIKGESHTVSDRGIEDTLQLWQQTISEQSKDRIVRYVITGNILQAFADHKGKLVSYTTDDGGINKGILMPEYWESEKAIQGKVDVPISKAVNIFKSLTPGQSISASHGMSFFRMHDLTFRLIVPSVMKEGGEVFLNAEVLKHVKDNNFEKIGKQMNTYVEVEYIPSLLEVLEKELGASVKLSHSQISNTGLVETKLKAKNSIVLPTNESEAEAIRILELEAEALYLELLLTKSPKNLAS